MSHDAGYTYITILIVVFVVALTAQSTFIPAATSARRADEAELIFRGLAYRAAIQSYHDAGAGAPQYPPDLQSLVVDPRFENVRHIRQLYDSPIGRKDWTLIREPQGG